MMAVGEEYINPPGSVDRTNQNKLNYTAMGTETELGQGEGDCVPLVYFPARRCNSYCNFLRSIN